MAARIEWIEMRLLNWARWKLSQGTGGLGYASVNLANPTPGVRDPYAEVPVPTNAIEAAATDDAVNRLHPGGLRLTVIEVYVGRGGIADKARRLCGGESTVYLRVAQAHAKLAEFFNAKEASARDERWRVEALQRTARPGGISGGGFTP